VRASAKSAGAEGKSGGGGRLPSAAPAFASRSGASMEPLREYVSDPWGFWYDSCQGAPLSV